MPAEVESLIVEFAFRIERHGADGMAFVMQADPAGVKAIGQGGCQLGYGGISHSLAIEIDTYCSADRCDDPPAPHISIHTRQNEPNDAHHRYSLWSSGSVPALSDGNLYHLRIELLHRTQLQVYMTDSVDNGWVRLTGEAIAVPDVWQYGNVCAGWTAATGGLHALHEITTFEIYAANNTAS